MEIKRTLILLAFLPLLSFGQWQAVRNNDTLKLFAKQPYLYYNSDFLTDRTWVRNEIKDSLAAHGGSGIDSSIYATKYWVDNVSNVGQWYNMYGTNASNWDNAATWVSNNGGNATNWDNTYNTVSNNSTNWDNAYNWGNHADYGYITSESDPTFTNSESYQLSKTDSKLQWYDGNDNQIFVPTGFGDMGMSSNTGSISVNATTLVTITGLTSSGYTQNTTVAGDSIKINNGGAGYYKVTVTGNGYYYDVTGGYIGVVITKNSYVNISNAVCVLQRKITTSEWLPFSGSAIVYLSVNDGIKARLYNFSASNGYAVINNIQVIIERIGR